MGLFGSRDPALGDRIRAAIATMQGDTGAAARFQQLQLERQRLGLQQQEAQRGQQQREDQIWGAKESGVGNPLIAAMSPGDLSQTLRERFTPYTGSPGGRHVMPSLNGGADTVDATPTTMAQEADALGRINPALRESYLAKQALSIVNGTDEQGRPTIQALDPRTVFTGQFAPMEGGAPSIPPFNGPPVTQGGEGQTPPISGDPRNLPPGDPRADTAVPPQFQQNPPPQEAPMFAGNVPTLDEPPGTTFRGVQFGNPVANMPNLNRRTRNAPRRNSQPQSAPLVRNVNDYNRLPRGAQYRLPDGSVRRKR